MQLFILTSHCTSRGACKVCRNKDGGRIWRKSLSKAFILPQALPNADPVDFECPFGLPWLDPVTSASIANTSQSKIATMEEARAKINKQTGSRGGCGCSRNK